jgi:hypothetical protein
MEDILDRRVCLSPLQMKHRSTPNQTSDAFSSMDNSVDKTKTWLAHFEKEYLLEKGTVEHETTLIIKDMLLSSDSYEIAARTAAQQIDDYHWERNSDSGTLFRFQDEGFYSLIYFLYHIIFETATLLPYNDSRQDLLVQLVIELPKCSSRSINGQSVCLSYSSL